MTHSPILDHFSLPLEVAIRPCERGDLEALEWFGMFTAHRQILHEAFARHLRGGNVMLVAVANGFPLGQAWIDLEAKAPEGAGVLWAVRVFPLFQGLGIGARLLRAAENVLRERGWEWAEIGVEKDNQGARRLYERTGYRLSGEERGEYTYTTPGGAHVRVPNDLWILRKRLSEGPGGDPP